MTGRIACAAWLAVVALFGAGCNALSSERPTAEDRRQLYFVALDDFPLESVEWFRRYYAEQFRLRSRLLPPLSLEDAAYAPGRRQIVGEQVVDLIRRTHPQLSRDPRAVVVALTYRDMRIQLRPDWQFAFSFYGGGHGGGRFGVVSTARMDPRVFGRPDDHALLFDRARKVTSKVIALLYYDLEPSDDPDSVLYNRILGLEELDAIRQEFVPRVARAS